MILYYKKKVYSKEYKCIYFVKRKVTLKCRKMQRSKGWMFQGLLVFFTTMYN